MSTTFIDLHRACRFWDLMKEAMDHAILHLLWEYNLFKNPTGQVVQHDLSVGIQVPLGA